MQGFSDDHIHSLLSLDGKSSLIDQVRASRKQGVTHLCFTEHIDYGMPEGDFTVDYAAYRRQIEEARVVFPDMDIRIGLELGDTEESRDRVVEASNAMELDFKLLSRHLVGGVDPYYADVFFAHRTRAQAAADYVQAVYESALAFPDYDALAHLGYVFKFAQGTGFPPLRHSDEPDVIDAILEHLIQHGRALELNTSRWNRFGEGIPGADILRRYHELGGELVTLGSDAHHTDAVAQGFPQAVQQLKEIGFRYLTSFAARKPRMNKIL